MRFRDAVERTPVIRGRYRDGLQALSAADRRRVSCREPRKRLRGSVNLDDAFRPAKPNSLRWDYAIGIRGGARADDVAYVEVHPASSGHVDEMLRKLGWLKTWLAGAGAPLGSLPRRYFWVASGSVALRKGSPQALRIAQQGLQFPTEHLNL
jgi:hypothetical protein